MPRVGTGKISALSLDGVLLPMAFAVISLCYAGNTPHVAEGSTPKNVITAVNMIGITAIDAVILLRAILRKPIALHPPELNGTSRC